MKVDIAFDLDKTRKISFQDEFPKTTKCCRCGSSRAWLGFVAHEGSERSIQDGGRYVSQVHNSKSGGLWLHDACAVAVYFCKDCLEPTALYNQA